MYRRAFVGTSDTETENFYSYEHKHTPHWGAAIGGIGGAVAGYYLGKKADKKYYILVPKNIRMAETKSSLFGNFLFGFVVVGPAMGGIAGWTLYTPMKGREGETDFRPECIGGYIVGSIIGPMIAAGYGGRAKRIRLWEKSLLEEKTESSLNIQLLPSDPSAFTICPRKLPSGETIYEYRMDILRVRF